VELNLILTFPLTLARNVFSHQWRGKRHGKTLLAIMFPSEDYNISKALAIFSKK
jgi:hypothetical protein